MAEEDGGPRGFSKKRSDVPESCATNRSYMMKQIISGGKNFIFTISPGMVLVRGILLILMGLFLFLRPLAALFALTYVLGIFSIAGGVLTFFQKGASEGAKLSAILMLLIGCFLVFFPGIANIMVMLTIAFWLIAGALNSFLGKSRVLPPGAPRTMSYLASGLSLLVGIFMIFFPLAGLDAMASICGIFLLLYGVFLCVFASYIRNV